MDIKKITTAKQLVELQASKDQYLEQIKIIDEQIESLGLSSKQKTEFAQLYNDIKEIVG